VANRIIVRWKDEYVWSGSSTNFRQQFADFNTQAECNVVNEFQYTDHDLIQVMDFDTEKYSVLDQLILYQSNEMVDYVQPDYLYEPTTTPNDPIYATNQWGLPKISMPSAWSNQTGSGSIVAAVLDTGANVNHREFSANLNANYHNFVDGSSNVADFAPYHGSNVASIIGAQGNNGLYMAGVAWDVSLMHLKVFPSSGGGADTDDIIAAMDWARNHGAKVMNLSLGNPHCTQIFCDPETGDCDCIGQWTLDRTLEGAMRNARDNDVVAVCAAGNDGNSNDSIPFAPSGLPEDNVISVAASDQSDARAIFTAGGSSNVGFKTVDLAAPGKGIYGLTQNDNGIYSIFDGTSQAAPHVTGAIALLKSEYGWENYHGLRDRVLMATDALSWGTSLRTGGRLNVNKALLPRTIIRNISTRARVESGNNIMIGGFIVSDTTGGTGRLKVAIRGLGPSLQGLTVAKLANPKITLKNASGQTIYSNDNWGTLPTSQKNDLAANGLTPTNSLEAAMVCAGSSGATGCDALAPGLYSVFLESSTGSSFGVGLFELYEIEGGLDQQTRLVNISTRCKVGTGDEVAIAGAIVGDPAQGGDTTIPRRSILMFGKGPSLGISGSLANPFLTLKNSVGGIISTNDSWTNVAAPTDELTEAGLNPSSVLCGTLPCESALWPILTSGVYTVTMNGVSNGTGVGLVELYEY
jgi:thermitase